MGFKKTVSAKNDAFCYEVIEECGTIATNGNWEMKLRYMKWGNNPAKYDIRYWHKKDDGTEESRRGLTLTTEEIEGLQRLLNKINSEEKIEI